MAKRFEITTNKTSFFHYCKTKAEAEKIAQETVEKFAANYGDTVLKIKRVWF